MINTTQSLTGMKWGFGAEVRKVRGLAIILKLISG
jgi:hypothetical protein